MKKLILIFIFLTATVSLTSATTMTWQLTGEVDYVNDPFLSIFSIGDLVEYTFVIDTSTGDSNTSTTRGEYENAIITAEIVVGSYSATIENYGIEIHNDDTVGFGGLHDLISFHLESPYTVFSGDDIIGSDGLTYEFISSINGSFIDVNASMLGSDQLPTSVDLINSQNDIESFYVGWLTNLAPGVYLMNGISTTNIMLTDITPSTVPEPSSLLLFGLGIIGIAGIRIKKMINKS